MLPKILFQCIIEINILVQRYILYSKQPELFKCREIVYSVASNVKLAQTFCYKPFSKHVLNS